MKSYRGCLASYLLVACLVPLGPLRLLAQTPAQLQTFHDQATGLITRLASRPLTPGDTFLTFSPEAGGLMHTVRAAPGLVESSLLRADGMIGTAHVEWSGVQVSRVEVLWTRADTLRGAGVDSAIVVHARTVGDSLFVTGSTERVLALPRMPWAVADFGMEEQLIPLFRLLPPGQQPVQVALLRPYHLRWDTIAVTLKDSAGLRMAVTLGSDRAHEVWIVDRDDHLLCVRRVDQPGDRFPLPNSARHAAFQSHIEAIRALLEPFPAPPPRTQ